MQKYFQFSFECILKKKFPYISSYLAHIVCKIHLKYMMLASAVSICVDISTTMYFCYVSHMLNHCLHRIKCFGKRCMQKKLADLFFLYTFSKKTSRISSILHPFQLIYLDPTRRVLPNIQKKNICIPLKSKKWIAFRS